MNAAALFVPCHRVLRTGGGLGGFAWGTNVKQALLDREAAISVVGEAGSYDAALAEVRRVLRPGGHALVVTPDPAGRGLQFVKQDKGAPITALAMSSGAARIAWADEDGHAGVASL